MRMLLGNKTIFEARMNDFANLTATEEEIKQSERFDLALKNIEKLIPEDKKESFELFKNVLEDSYCKQLSEAQENCYNYGLDDGLSITSRVVMASRRNKSKRIIKKLRSTRIRR